VPGALLSSQAVTPRVVPTTPPVDLAVAENFERFDGFEPLDHPATQDGLTRPQIGVTGSPRPGQGTTPLAEQVYTPSELFRPVGVVGGQPLPVSDRIHRPPGAYTPGRGLTIQWRLGVGQHGPSALGAAQTVQLSEITNNPPQPGDLTSIIAGQA
jgi:hypothetical protein